MLPAKLDPKDFHLDRTEKVLQIDLSHLWTTTVSSSSRKILRLRLGNSLLLRLTHSSPRIEFFDFMSENSEWKAIVFDKYNIIYKVSIEAICPS